MDRSQTFSGSVSVTCQRGGATPTCSGYIGSSSASAKSGASRPLTAAKIWLSVKCRSVMALAGHSDEQLPQPMQTAAWISALLNSLICGAWYGQTWTQVAQATHLSGSIQAIWPLTGIFFFERIEAARPATAFA